MPSDHRLQRLRRVARACDFCHNRGVRCQPSRDDKSKCQKCIDFDQPCTYTRPVQKRGLKPKRNSGPSATTHSTPSSPNLADHGEGEQGRQETRRDSNNHDGATFHPHNGVANSESPAGSINSHWRAESLPDDELIGALIEIYLEIVYPM